MKTAWQVRSYSDQVWIQEIHYQEIDSEHIRIMEPFNSRRWGGELFHDKDAAIIEADKQLKELEKKAMNAIKRAQKRLEKVKCAKVLFI